VSQSLLFKHQHLHEHIKNYITTTKWRLIDDAVNKIVNDPFIGEAIRGDLSGVFVYKFKIQTQETLLAYEFDPNTRYLLLLGSHENFYLELKRKN
jgi:hypothetical protein